MNKRTAISAGAAAMAMAGAVGIFAASPRGSEPATRGAKAFTAAVAISELKDGRRVVAYRPILRTTESVPAFWLLGGHVVLDAAVEPELEFGTSARVTVREAAGGRLAADVYVGVAKLDISEAEAAASAAAGGGKYGRVAETGVRTVKEIRPGDTIAVDLPDGRHVDVTIDRAE